MVLDALASSLRRVARGLLTGLAVLALALGAGLPATAPPAPAAPPAPVAQAAPAAQAALAAQPVVAESTAESSASVAAAGTTDTSVDHQVPLATQIAFRYGRASDLSIRHGAAAAWLPAGSRPALALGQRAPPRH